MKFLSFLGQKVIVIWSFFLFTLLVFSSLLVRTTLPMDGSELARMHSNRFLFFIALILFLIAFICLIHLSSFVKANYLFIIGSLIYLAFGFYLIFHQNDMPRHDALAVLKGARALNKGDYSLLSEVSGYFHKYPHQLGLASFERLILTIFGANNVKIFFFLNLLMAITDNFLIWKISDKIFDNTQVSKIVIILSFIFLPQIFSILFIYGLTYGLFFALLGLYAFQIYLTKHNWLSLTLSTLFFLISDIIRNNYIILILTVLMILILDFLVKPLKKNLIMIVALILGTVFVNRAINWHYKEMAHISNLDGEPKIAWVAMGLDDKAPAYHRVYGWYDAYVETVYNQYNGDSEKIEKDSKKLLSKRLKTLQNTPEHTFTFFKDKFISTWTDSLFQSVWSGPVTKMPVENQKVSGKLMTSIYEEGRVYHYIYQFSALLLVLIYMAVLPTLGVYWKKLKTGEFNFFWLIPVIYLSGGVIFHLFWETKSQYVYPYVYLLLPLSAYGLYWLYEKISMKHKKSGSF